MRCRACNALMSDADLSRIDPTTGDYSEHCGACHHLIQLDIADMLQDPPEYVHGGTTEGYGTLFRPLSDEHVDEWN